MALVSIDTLSKGVVQLTLNRPEVHNAFSPPLISDLTLAFDRLGQDPSIRALVLTGQGRSFCAGADIDWMRSVASASQKDNADDARRLAHMFYTVNSCPKPVIALVNGAALGGGMGLVACCDIAIADTKAMFGLTEVRIGLAPATISPFVLSKIGLSQARRFMITAERFTAKRAQEIGLVHEVSDDSPEVLSTLLEAILANAPDAMADTKSLLTAVAGREIDSTLMEMTSQRIAARRATSEAREGLTAFLDKRAPSWSPDHV